MDFQKFEEKLNNNLYKIWNRMSSGSYFPQPVMAVEIPKKTGGVRRLGIPTITDRIAQMVARMYVERAVEPMFCEDSYGYRPNKSALDAVEMTRKRCWRYDYVIELDVKGLFDNIDHELLMRVVYKHVKETWACLYIERWLKTPFVLKSGEKKTGCKIDMIAEILNPLLRGWINYFGKFNPSAMRYTLQCIERRLVKWAMSKYKRLRGHRRRAERWLESVRKREPKLFAHWNRLYTYC